MGLKNAGATCYMNSVIQQVASPRDKLAFLLIIYLLLPSILGLLFTSNGSEKKTVSFAKVLILSFFSLAMYRDNLDLSKHLCFLRLPERFNFIFIHV